MKIYIVMGTTGEYSGSEYWVVKAFTTLEKAQELIINATKRAKEIEATRPSQYDVPKNINEFDVNMKMDYTGTQYSYYETELVE